MGRPMNVFRDFLKIYWPLVAVAFLGVIIALIVMDPAPPKKVKFAAGSPGGAYYAFAERYQRLLGDEGVTVELIETSGSVDNLRMLSDDDAQIGLVQGGLATAKDGEELRSLGGLYHEPFWVFVRTDVDVIDFGALRNLRLAIGPVGSGTRQLALDIQAEYRGDWPQSARLSLSGGAAAEALMAGTIDAAVFTASPDAAYLDRLLRSPDIRLMSLAHANALARRQRALGSVTLFSGVVDVGAHLPAEDVNLVAPVAQLVVREDLHPALETLLIEAAISIHADSNVLAEQGVFPDPDMTDLPLSKQAARYYRNGPSFLRRYFSFGVANFLDRAWVLAIPLLTLLFPLVRAGPPIYRWRVRRKIYVWYDDLRRIEKSGRVAQSSKMRDSLYNELSTLQAEVGNLEVPLSYTDDLYRLRNHIEFVKQLIRDDDSGNSNDRA